MSSDESLFIESEQEMFPNDEDSKNVPFQDEEACDSGDEPDDKSNHFEFGWSKQDLATLLRRMKKATPKKDRLTFQTRLKKLDWDSVAFGDHSVQDCREVWLKIQNLMRKHRCLSEVLQDLRKAIQNGDLPTQHELSSSEPPRPKSAYIFFVKENKEAIGKENPHSSFRELLPVLAAKYESLPPEAKEKYIRLARKSSEEYRASRAKLIEGCPVRKKVRKRKKIATKIYLNDNPIKTPFGIYRDVQSKKREHTDGTEEFENRCYEKWRKMSEDKKMFWINWAEEQFIVYKKEHRDKTSKLHSVLTNKEMKIRDKYIDKPVGVPRSGHLFFLKKMMEKEDMKNLKLPFKDGLEFVRLQWTQLKEDATHEIRQFVEDAKKQYAEELNNHFENLPICDKAVELYRPRQSKSLGVACIAEKEPPTKKKRKNAKKTKDTTSKKAEPICPESTIEEYYRNLQKLRMRTSTWEECPKKEQKIHKENWLRKKQKYIVEYKEFLQSLTREELQEYICNMNLKKKCDETICSSPDGSEAISLSEISSEDD